MSPKEVFNRCKGGKHNLIVIDSNHVQYNEYAVVRWCKDCGAVVCDREYDNRVQAGWYKKMKFSNLQKSMIED